MSATNVYQAISAVSGALGARGIAKTKKLGSQVAYAFRGIDEVMNELSPLLVEHGLVVLPRAISRACVERQTKAGGALFYVTVEVEFDFVSVTDGTTHTARMFGEAMDTSDKATNKAMSAAYKYAAFQTFCIPTEGADDADAISHDVAPHDATGASHVIEKKSSRQSKKDDDWGALGRGLDACASLDTLSDFLRASAGQVNRMPDKWREHWDDRVSARRDSINAREAA